MPIELVKECDAEQGYNFKPDTQRPFGYLNRFVLGDNNIAPDIKVVEPASIMTAPAMAAGSAGAVADTSGVFTKPVVAVLETVQWSTLPNDNLTLRARISVANMQQLSMLAMQSLKRVVVMVSFVVYQYDPVEKKYFSSVKSFKSQTPNGVTATPGGGAGFGSDPADAQPIYALLGKTSGTEFGLQIDPVAENHPSGIKSHALNLTLAPPIAKTPQQILVQSSSKIKLIQPWGIPQN